MAGNQASVMVVGSYDGENKVVVNTFTPYKVPNHNTPPSTSYFNKVKAWMREHMAFETKQWETKFGEKVWWDMVYKDMTDYTFNFEGNQATFLFYKYRKDLDEDQKKPCGEIRGKIRYKQADSK